jgi:hypothetical protein
MAIRIIDLLLALPSATWVTRTTALGVARSGSVSFRVGSLVRYTSLQMRLRFPDIEQNRSSTGLDKIELLK